jgi:protein tyrosine kinase modulator
MNVANELMTKILQEDVRSRTGVATEATRFLGKEVEQLEGKINALDSQISQLTNEDDSRSSSDALSTAKALDTLRAELAIKSASFSDSHPVIRALKQKIKALEKLSVAKAKSKASGIDALESRKDALKTDLTKVSEKLAAARLGESLERGQYSERLEAIEQPSLPQEPVSPNRKKLFAITVVLALMAGGGLVMALEMFDTTIHRGEDIFKLVDRHLIVAIPYISTQAEELHTKRVKRLAIGVSAAVVVAGLLAAFLLLPVDLVFDKITSHLPL